MAKLPDEIKVPVEVTVVRTGGDWWRVAGRVADLIADLHGTELADWEAALAHLHRRCLRTAGKVGEQELQACRDGRPAVVAPVGAVSADAAKMAEIVRDEFKRQVTAMNRPS